MTTVQRTMAVIGLLAAQAAHAGETAPPFFTAKPTAESVGDAVKIEFAVSRKADVTVCIEDGNGKIVRRLVSGVLGNDPPAPLKPGLAQSMCRP